MVAKTSKQVLVTRVEDSAYRRIADVLRQSAVDVHRSGWDSTTLELVQSTQFDVIVIGYPVTEAALGRFLEVARADGSACRRSGLVLISDRDHEQAASAMIGKGVNRVVNLDTIENELMDATQQLTTAAPRLPVRVPARIKLFADGRQLRVMAQIENLSTSGMLLRGVSQFPVGTTFDFEITIPGDSAPVNGTAEITRSTDPDHESVEGIGVRFLSFTGADKLRLEMFLDRQLS